MIDKKRDGGCVMSMVKLMIGGVILFVIIAVIVSSTKKEPPSSEQLADREKRLELKNGYYAARGFVKTNLKSPSTAKFSLYPGPETGSAAIESTTNRFYATGYVDAQNAFGARLRQTWRVEMIHAGDQWKFYHLKLGDQVLLDVKSPAP